MKSQKKKRHHVVRNLLILLVILGIAAAVWVLMEQNREETAEEETTSYKQETVKYGSVITGITESGSVAYGTTEQVFSVPEVVETSSESSVSTETGNNDLSADWNQMGQGMSNMGGMESMASESSSAGSDTELEVGEVCVAVGQVVSEGTELIRLTEDSVAAYREELDSAVESAELSVRQEEINVESKKAEADYTYAMYIAEGENAEETYNATIKSLDNAVTELEEELEEASEEVETLQSEYDAGEDVEEDLEAAQLNYDTVESNLQIAENNRTTQSIEAKQTYETAITNYNYADQLYEIDTNGLEDDLNDAQEVLEEAQAAQTEFDEQISDGAIYAEYAGTILSVSCSAGDTLTNDSVLVTFSDENDVTITVSVAQEDIADISIGEPVSISLTAYENETFDGEVTGISTAAEAGSATVNYEVTAAFTGDTSKVYSGMSGEVTFVTKEEADTLYISNRAVWTDGPRSYVKVLREDGSVDEVTITTGYSNGTTVAVTSGLEEGEIVLIESQVTE